MLRLRALNLLSVVVVLVTTTPTLRAQQGGVFATPSLEREAVELLESRRFTQLDRLLRALLREDGRRAEAAALLRDLDRIPAYEPTLDEEQLDEAISQLGWGFDVRTSRHFVVVSNGAPDWTRERLWLLERTYDQFFRAAERLNLDLYPPEHKLLCILIEDHEAYRAFARAHDGVDASWIAGYYASLSNRVVFYDDRTGPAFARALDEIERHRDLARDAERAASKHARSKTDARDRALVDSARSYVEAVESQASQLAQETALASMAKTIHEAIHLLAFNCGLQSRARQYPLWLTEGLASRFETTDPDRAFGPGSSVRSRDIELRLALEQEAGVPLETLIALNHVPASAEEDHLIARTIYAQADALFEWCYRYEREALARYFEDIAREPPGLISPRRHAAMFEARFGDPARLEREWRREERRRLGLR